MLLWSWCEATDPYHSLLLTCIPYFRFFPDIEIWRIISRHVTAQLSQLRHIRTQLTSFIEKTSWTGCGEHIPRVIDGVAEQDRCTITPKVKRDGKEYPPMAMSKVCRVFSSDILFVMLRRWGEESRGARFKKRRAWMREFKGYCQCGNAPPRSLPTIIEVWKYASWPHQAWQLTPSSNSIVHRTVASMVSIQQVLWRWRVGETPHRSEEESDDTRFDGGKPWSTVLISCAWRWMWRRVLWVRNRGVEIYYL